MTDGRRLDLAGVRERLSNASLESRFSVTEQAGRVVLEVCSDTKDNAVAYRDLARVMFGDAENVVVSDDLHEVEYR